MKTTLYRNLIVGVCLFVVATFSRAEKPAALRGTPMLLCSTLPCADVTVNGGKRLRLLIDLGDEESVLDSAAAKALGLTLTPVEGKDGYNKSTLPGAHLGEVSLGDIPVVVTDVSTWVSKDQFPKADGTLAYTVFKDRLLKMDYKKNKILVSEPMTSDPPCPGFCGSITETTFGKGRPHVLVTTGFSVNGKPITAQIDTLYAGTLVIYPQSVEKLGLQRENTATATRFFNYTDGGVDMRESHVGKQAFGSNVLARSSGIFFATPKVRVPDGMFDGTVGGGLFTGHVVYVDLHSNRFWISN
jgi:Aspartyl protease